MERMTAAPNDPLRVAVVGAGPAGIYVADALITRSTGAVEVDMFDRLPTPYGLLRYGVAPDHIKMKSLVKALQRTLDDDRVSFFGGVSIGTDITVEELLGDYHAVVYSFGASADRRLGIPGEDLAGSHSATEFVSWYCGHPDYADARFDLTATSVAVIGLGNVALDVARVLLRNPDELSSTDVPDAVLAALRASSVTDVHIVGRRGPQHAKFTHKELRELGELDGVDVVLDPAVMIGVDDTDSPRGVRHNLEILTEWTQRVPTTAPRRLHLHLGATPARVLGEDRVEGLRVTHVAGGSLDIPAQLILRSVGNLGLGLPGVPLDDATGTIPTEEHRVVGGTVAIGEYAAGWIKRGAVGVIGTNRSDATETVEALLADIDALRDRDVTAGSAAELLRSRGVAWVSLEGWSAIDAAEILLGQRRDSPRVKLASWDELAKAGATVAE
jgi:ferredoxin--NADP+ reductase